MLNFIKSTHTNIFIFPPQKKKKIRKKKKIVIYLPTSPENNSSMYFLEIQIFGFKWK